MIVRTPNNVDFDYGSMTVGPEVTSLVFRVQAKNDATIRLTKVPGDTSSADRYEIIIGAYANTKSMIRLGKRPAEPKKVVDTPSVLNETEMRYFWISWKGGNIEVGRGIVRGLEKFMDWKNSAPFRVGGVSVGSGWGSAAEYRIDLIPGEYNS